MSSQLNYITPQGLKALQDEVIQLHQIERPKIVETVAWAASNGDRSENGDYIYGKRRLREIDRRLHFLSKRIEAAQVIDPKTLSGKKIVFGATVTIETESGDEKSYQIVGEDESNPKQNKISWKSPLAKALLGKTFNDDVEIKKPNGSEWVSVINIQFI